MPEANAALDYAEGFKAALLCEDDIGKVIRTHIYIESILNEFVDFALLRPSYLKHMKLDYFGKVNLAICIGLNEDLRNPLLKIGNIRNKFAHRPNQVINKELANDFYTSFSEKQKETINSIEKASLGNERSKGQHEDASERFTSLAMALFYLLKIDASVFTKSTKIVELLQAIGQLHAKASEDGK